jgi:hypothetical protein
MFGEKIMPFPVENASDTFQKASAYSSTAHRPQLAGSKTCSSHYPKSVDAIQSAAPGFLRPPCFRTSARCTSRLNVNMDFREKTSGWDVKSPKPDARPIPDKSRDLKDASSGWEKCCGPLSPTLQEFRVRLA